MSSRDVGKDIHQTPDRESPSSSPPSASSEPTWPKGWRPWTSLFGCFLLMWNSWGLINAYGTFESYYQQHLLPGRDLHLWNMVGSTQSFMILSFSFVVGRICDAGHSKALMITGSLLVTVGMFLLSVVNGHGTEGEGNYGLIWFTQGFVQGLGMSCFFVTSSTGNYESSRKMRCRQLTHSVAVAATWFVNKKPTAIGIVASGASIGVKCSHSGIIALLTFTSAGLVYPTMTTFTIKYLGFNNAIRAIAGLIGCTCLISVLLAVPNPAHEFHSPEKWLNVRVWVDPRAFRHPPFCWLTASISFMFLGFYAIFFNIEGVSDPGQLQMTSKLIASQVGSILWIRSKVPTARVRSRFTRRVEGRCHRDILVIGSSERVEHHWPPELSRLSRTVRSISSRSCSTSANSFGQLRYAQSSHQCLDDWLTLDPNPVDSSIDLVPGVSVRHQLRRHIWCNHRSATRLGRLDHQPE